MRLVMTIRSKALASALLLTTCAYASGPRPAPPYQQTAPHPPAPGLLSRDQAAPILPPSVFFRGQTATIQARNSAGIRLADGKLILVALVDTSGYSSALQQTYQAYLLTEAPLTLAGQQLVPGAYGFGFVAGNKLTVMDIGGNEILHAATTRDDSLARPTPLQILPGSAPGIYRLYLGRSYALLSPAGK
jgi:hypothetical protein